MLKIKCQRVGVSVCSFKGGCLSLEEVRLKQQKEMMQAQTRGSRKRCDVIKAA